MVSPQTPHPKTTNGPIVGVVGSRGYKPLGEVDRWVTSLAMKHPTAVIVSGGARDVDRRAEDAGRASGLDVISFRPYRFHAMNNREMFSIETETIGDRAQAIIVAASRRINPPVFASFASCAKHRNGWIVETCKHLVAFWDGRSAGTFDAMTKARKVSKLAAVRPNDAAVIAELRLALGAKPE